MFTGRPYDEDKWEAWIEIYSKAEGDLAAFLADKSSLAKLKLHNNV